MITQVRRICTVETEALQMTVLICSYEYNSRRFKPRECVRLTIGLSLFNTKRWNCL